MNANTRVVESTSPPFRLVPPPAGRWRRRRRTVIALSSASGGILQIRTEKAVYCGLAHSNISIVVVVHGRYKSCGGGGGVGGGSGGVSGDLGGGGDDVMVAASQPRKTWR